MQVDGDGLKDRAFCARTRDDARKYNLGYCRSVVRPDGRIVTLYYYTTAERPENHIAATIWEP